MLVDTEGTFTKAPRATRAPKERMQRLGVPVEAAYTAVLADGSRVERTEDRTMIRLDGNEFPTPVAFAEDREQSLLGTMALKNVMLAVDPHCGEC